MNDSFSKPELLAPAGGLEQLRYALHFGADAVYCATDRFGLRQRADNFSLDELAEAVRIAHAKDACIYVTCNAYMSNSDVRDLPPYLEHIAEAGVDALIVSDLGAMRQAKKYAPDVALHVSTQASCSNIEAAFAWYELGAKRIVCAREMSINDIAQMRKALPDDLELEVFVHGAMCMAISGRCLISDYLTDRSANRGHCTQPCRWGYELTSEATFNGAEEVDCEGSTAEGISLSLEEKSRPGKFLPIEEDSHGTYIMNAKDLCMLEHLDDLKAAGIDSLKIEGRNKRAFYVATVVNAYRQVLDGADPQQLTQELELISHRPYSTGFFYGSAQQETSGDEYTQMSDWVGEVIEMAADGRVTVKCRNRFYEGDVLEVLSPHHPIEKLEVCDLRREYPDGNSEPVEIANRAMDTYSFASSLHLEPQDILRSKRRDPAKKN